MTLPSLTIEGFRAFRRLEVPRLARVNLIVGSNNVGKTSVLEALQLLASPAAFSLLLESILRNRRELATERSTAHDVDFLRVFHGPSGGQAERQLRIDGGTRSFSMARAWVVPDDQGQHLLPNKAGRFRFVQGSTAPALDAVEVFEVAMAGVPPLPLTLDAAFALPNGWIERAAQVELELASIPAAGLSEVESAELWDSVVLQGEEELLVEALRVIAPEVG